MTATQTSDDRDYKETVRREWTAAASGWRKWFEMHEAEAAGRAVTSALLERVGLQPGDVVLDVGAGYGEPGLSAAALVGRDGHVTCLDISGDMLAFAEERARAAGLSNVRFVEGDIESAELAPGSYDVVLSRAALMYASDPLATLRQLRRSLRARRPPGRCRLGDTRQGGVRDSCSDHVRGAGNRCPRRRPRAFRPWRTRSPRQPRRASRFHRRSRRHDGRRVRVARTGKRAPDGCETSPRRSPI